jgi:hypothetical protein
MEIAARAAIAIRIGTTGEELPLSVVVEALLPGLPTCGAGEEFAVPAPLPGLPCALPCPVPPAFVPVPPPTPELFSFEEPLPGVPELVVGEGAAAPPALEPDADGPGPLEVGIAPFTVAGASSY